MTGSLQIKNNKYYIVLNFKDKNGKRKQKWISTDLEVRNNKKKANELLRKTLLEQSERNMDYDGLLVCEYFEEWILMQKSLVSKSTFRSYEGNMKNHIIPYFKLAGIKLLDLKPYHLDDYYHNKLVEQHENKPPLSAQTIRHHHQNISKALNDAVRRELIKFNPAHIARPPKVKKYIGLFLNPKQLKELILLFKDTPIELLVAFIATYGLRRSEALGLCWQYVDLENAQFTVAKTVIQHIGENYVKDCTKNDSSFRTLPLTKDIKELFIKHKEEQQHNMKLFGSEYNKSDFVFTWPNGNSISPNYLSSTFHDVVIKSSLPPIRLHDLRHSTASNLLANNFSVVEVQHWLGHSAASTTLDFYSHIDGKSKANISSALEKLIPLENR